MYKKILAIIFVLCLALPVSAKRQSEEIITTMTQLQKRTFQTRTYASSDKVLVMKALLNVLQDEGFMVYNVNSLLGFIYSVKDFDTTDPNIDISKEFGLTKSRLNYNGIKVATLESSANVTEYGDNIRVRVNFKRKLLNEYGNAQLVEDIDESSFYDEFYSKVDNALNLQKRTSVPVVKELPVVQKVEPKSAEPKEVSNVVESEVIDSMPESEANDIVEPTTQNEEAQMQEQESNSEESSYAQDSQMIEEISEYSEKEQKQLEKMMQKEEKEKEKIKAKEAKEQEKLAKELAKEQAKQAKEEAKIIKELEKMNK